MLQKIIAAPATASGVAGVSMVRISGQGSIALVDKIFKATTALSDKKSHEIAYGKIIHPTTGNILDEVMIGVFHHGRSFTGEESLEIWTHGSPYIVKELMNVLTSMGISVAEPGEFSMRAFLNGKIDLTQAEAIKDLTESQTKFAHAQAIGRLEGKLSSQIDHIHAKTLDILSLFEVAIDHAEEEFDLEDFSDRYAQKIEDIDNAITQMISHAQVGKMSTEGIRVALVGRPNVGKSSLLNALVAEDRVIVSDIAGTTRDVIEHRVSSHGLLIRFFDTAGLRETEDILEKEGTKRSLDAIEKSDMVIHVLDSSMELQQEDQDIIDLLYNTNKTIVTVFNKNDLPTQLSATLFAEPIYISTHKNEGLSQIFQAISDFYFSGGIDPENDVFIANIRQETLLRQAKSSLEEALRTLRLGESEEFVASHIRKARYYLEEIVGKTTDDAILDRIFSQFCIGK